MHNVAAQGVTPKSPRDYMPLLKQDVPREQPEEDMKRTWEAICKAMENQPAEEG
jgi:hypothetical protein